MKDSIKTSWHIQKPWFDFRLKRREYNFHFSVIQLRAQRKPLYYLLNGVLPIFLVVSCSFAQSIITYDDFLGDKLTYIITLLLTTAAFQYTLSSELPKTSETTRIDSYILIGYFILSVLTLQIAITKILFDIDYDNSAIITEVTILCACALIWIIKSIMFLTLYIKSRNNNIDWKMISIKQKKQWSSEMKDSHKYISIDYDNFEGTGKENDDDITRL